MTKTWPSGPPSGPGVEFRAIFITQCLNKKLQGPFCTRFEPPQNTWGPEMANTWPSGPSSGPGVEFKAIFHKTTLK